MTAFSIEMIDMLVVAGSATMFSACSGAQRALALGGEILLSPLQPSLGRFQVVSLFTAAVAIAIAWIMWRRFIARETVIGRLAPVTPVDTIDDRWLRKNLFSIRPEVAGALWDEAVDEKEVAAILARLSAEGKLKSRLTMPEEKPMSLLLSSLITDQRDPRPVLHLQLGQNWDQFEAYERDLIKALFLGSSQTDTVSIRRHYVIPFVPAAVVQQALLREVGRMIGPPPPTPPERPAILVPLLFLALSFACFIRGAMLTLRADEPLRLVAMTLGGFLLFFIAGVPAGFKADAWSLDVTASIDDAKKFRWPLLLPFVTALVAAVCATDSTGVVITLFFSLWALAIWSGILGIARSRFEARTMVLRKQLGAALNFLRHVLAIGRTLPETWLPYVIAFGLIEDEPPHVRDYTSFSPARQWAIAALAMAEGAWRYPANALRRQTKAPQRQWRLEQPGKPQQL